MAHIKLRGEVLRGRLRHPGQSGRRPCEVGAVRLEGQVAGDDHLLAQLAVERQLGIEAVSLQVEDQHPGGERSFSRGLSHSDCIQAYKAFWVV